MKTRNSRRKNSALTFLEMVIVLVAVAMVVLIGVRFLAKARVKSSRLGCASYLRDIGLAFRMWANDNGEQFPMAVSTDQGGTKEYNETGQVFQHFLALSNELNSPRSLVCEKDNSRIRATNWATGFNNQNISYFVGLDAVEKNPQMLLAGDRHITGGLSTKGNIMVFNSNSPARWTTKLHDAGGNIGFADGSADQVTGTELRKCFGTNGVTRLAIP